MHVKTITIGYGRTHSLPSYANVKPSLSLTADLDAGEDLHLVIATLEGQAIAHVHGRIDNELERAGYSPVFDKSPRYSLWKWHQREALVVLPAEQSIAELPGNWRRHGICQNMRYHTVTDAACKVGDREGIEVLVINKDYDDMDELWSWYRERRWYRPLVLESGSDPWNQTIARVFLVPNDIQAPPGLRRLHRYLPNSLCTGDSALGELIAQLDDVDELRDLWFIVTDDPDAVWIATIPLDRVLTLTAEGLAAYVERWLADNLRPGTEEFMEQVRSDL